MKLPSSYKRRLTPAFHKVIREISAIPKSSGLTMLLLTPDEVDRDQREYLRRKRIPFIVEKISEVLSEMEKEDVEP